MYKLLIKPVLFLFDPEWVHHTVFALLKWINKIPGMGALIRSLYQVKDKRLERKLFGLTFPNPVGLAAGFDKDAKLYHELSNFGFGFVEMSDGAEKAIEAQKALISFASRSRFDQSTWV